MNREIDRGKKEVFIELNPKNALALAISILVFFSVCSIFYSSTATLTLNRSKQLHLHMGLSSLKGLDARFRHAGHLTSP